ANARYILRFRPEDSHALRDRAQQRVPRLPPKGLVYLPKALDIGQRHCRVSPAMLRARQRLRQPLAKQRTIGEAGQRVELRNSALVLATRGDVARNAVNAHDFAGLVVRGSTTAFQPPYLAVLRLDDSVL